MNWEAARDIVGVLMLAAGMVAVIVCAAAGFVTNRKPREPREEEPEEGQAKYMG